MCITRRNDTTSGARDCSCVSQGEMIQPVGHETVHVYGEMIQPVGHETVHVYHQEK